MSPGPTPLLELACLGIVALYVAVRGWKDADRRSFLVRLALLSGASWLAEDTCIRAYHFYAYAPGWSLFIDQVPLLIVVIWPVVIHTAWDLARHLARPSRVPLVGALIVLADASLIEPIAVGSGLWAWSEPGLFAVPPIGILGWSFFAFFALQVFERAATTRHLMWLFPVTTVGTHLMLVALWWGALRWVNGDLAPWPFVALAWALSLALAVRAWIARTDVARVELLLRMPAAAFFFVLLALHGGDAALVVYALAFAPPYLVMTALSWRAPQPLSD